MQQGSDNLNTLTNALYCLVDVLETNLMDLEGAFRKQGFALRFDAKRNFNAALHALKKLKSDVNKTSMDTQEHFGNDADMINADMINAMIMTFIDRTGEDDMMAYKIYEYLKSFPSKLNLNTDFDWAFEHVFKKDEDERK